MCLLTKKEKKKTRPANAIIISLCLCMIKAHERKAPIKNENLREIHYWCLIRVSDIWRYLIKPHCLSITQPQCNSSSLYEEHIIFRFFQWILKEKSTRSITVIKMLTQMHVFLHFYLAANPHLCVISCLFFSRPDLEHAWPKDTEVLFQVCELQSWLKIIDQKCNFPLHVQKWKCSAIIFSTSTATQFP